MTMPRSMLALTLIVDGRAEPLAFPVRRVINAGYVGRDRQAVLAHLEELEREGISPPPSVPMLFALACDVVTTSPKIEVIGGRTSGEIEYVLLVLNGTMFVGVGSDHTDRALEAHDLAKSKQICPNVLAREVWRFEDVRDHWDSLVMQSWVRPKGAIESMAYQHADLRAMLEPERLLEIVREQVRDHDLDGLVLYSGTVPLLSGSFSSADCFRGELYDPQHERRLTFEYEVACLDDLL